MLNNGIKKLSDDMLEEVTGGAGRNYTDNQLIQAGVIVEGTGKNTKYYAMVNKAKTEINLNTAKDMYECYCVAGNQQLKGSALTALIDQNNGAVG